MYQKPRLDRFGTFRQLTLFGFTGPDCDGGSIFGIGGSEKGCEIVQTTETSGGGS